MGSWNWEYLLLAGGLLLVAGYLVVVARRLDRVHRRVEGATHTLDSHLARRAQVATAVALGAGLEPATATLVYDAASRAAAEASAHPSAPLSGFSGQREAAESALSQVLRLALDDVPDGDRFWSAGEVGELAEVCHRMRLARRLHNDAVTAGLVLRRKRVVRWLRLSGTAELPQTVEIDDEPPARLVATGVPGGF